MLVRVMDGTLKPRDKILLMATGAVYMCEQVGVFTPQARSRATSSRPARSASSSPASRS